MRHLLAACLASFLALSLAACGDPPADADPIDAGRGVDGGGPDAADPVSCTDGVKNGDEAAVDCGGSCATDCAVGVACNDTSDCAQGAQPVDCSSAASCDGFDCPKVCMVNHGSCYPNPCSVSEVCEEIGATGQIVAAHCKRRHAAGEACSSRQYDKDLNDCIDGYACLPVPGHPFDDTCQVAPVTPNRQAGENCLNDEDCGTGLFCSNGYTCAARGALDASCFSGNIPCQTGLYCKFPVGLTCDSWIDCGSNMACCATATGAQCRTGAWNQCTPPAGVCHR